MTTVVDPAGTPSPIYSRSGTTIYGLTAQGTDGTTTAVISIFSGTTVVLVTTDSLNNAVLLPSGVEVGSVVEIYKIGDTAGTAFAFTSSGDTMNDGSEFIVGATTPSGLRLRKTTSTNWVSMGGNT